MAYFVSGSSTSTGSFGQLRIGGATNPAGITLKNESNYYAMIVNQQGAQTALYLNSVHQTGNVIHIDTPATTTGYGIQVEQNLLTSGGGLWVLSAAPSATQRSLVKIENQHASAVNVVAIETKGAKYAISGSSSSTGSFGMVGIGTASPGRKLEVAGGTIFGAHDGGDVVHINRYNAGSPNAYLYAGDTDRNVPVGLIFGTRGTDGAMSDNMIISCSGNVGIGTLTPGSDATGQLHVASAGDTIARFQSTNVNGDVYTAFENSADNNHSWTTGRANDGKFYIKHSAGGHHASGTQTVRLSIGTTGYVGIGTTAPDSILHTWRDAVEYTTTITQNQGNGHCLDVNASASDNNTQIHSRFRTNVRSSLMTILNNGKVGIGVTDPAVQLELSTDSDDTNLYLTTHHDTNTARPNLIFRKSGGSHASPTTVADDELLGIIEWNSYDGDSYGQSAQIKAEIDGTPGDSDVPGRLVFLTTADGAQGSSERMVINNAGNVGIGTNNPGTKLVVAGAINAFDNGGSTDGILYATRTNGTTNVQLHSNGVSYLAGGNVGIGDKTPNNLLSVKSATGTYSHFGGIATTNTHYSGITLGYMNDADATNQKTAIVQEQIGDGQARGHLHFLVDIADDINSAVLADSKMMIHGTSGNVGIGTATPGGILSVGADNDTYFSAANPNTINFFYNENGDTGGWVNFRGYQAGTSQPRDFMVGDGQGNRIATFDGSTSRVGIGTNTPGVALEVIGSISGSSSSTGSFGKVGVGVAATGINYGAKLGVAGSMYLGGAGTSYPQNTLHVQGTGITMSEGDRDRTSMHPLSAAADKGGIYFKCRLSSSPTEHFRIDYDGTLTATDTTIASNSDIRTKKEIANYTGPITGSMSGSTSLELIDSLTIKHWKHTGDYGTIEDREGRGLIAQEVTGSVPYILSTTSRQIDQNYSTTPTGSFVDVYNVGLTNLIPDMLNAIKELSAKVKELEDA